MAIVSAVFSSYFLLFVTFSPTSSASQYARCCIYGKRSLPHSDMVIHEHSIRDIAMREMSRRVVDCSCTVSCRHSARGMCSMNTSSYVYVNTCKGHSCCAWSCSCTIIIQPESTDVHADHNLPSNLHFLHAVSVVITVPQAVLHVVAKHV